jgi:preprotein translocase subunit SecG
MSTFSIFLVLITIVCFLLIVVIMVQNPKGGGLSSTLGGSQMLGGVQKTTHCSAWREISHKNIRKK